jgi:hypothetical protein
MWAMKHVDQLLKLVNDSGNGPLDEVIQLGESFSIVTPYTSFLVLENDAEYQRWQIERRNLDRLQRDRRAQARRQEQLQAMRDKALRDLGPQPQIQAEKKPAAAPTIAAAPQTREARPTAPSAPPRTGAPGRQSRNFDFGSGPVGPLFVGASWLMARRKRKKTKPAEQKQQ